MRALFVTLGSLLLVTSVQAQADCNPSSGSREADVFAHFSVPIAYSLGQAPWLYLPGTTQFSLDAAFLPDASARIRTPARCRPTAGPENWNLATLLPRPRAGFALGDGVLLEMSWLPPIRTQGIKPNLWSFALSRTVPMNRKGALFTGRAHATFGSVRGPITCPSSATGDPASPCFDGTTSDDKFAPNIFGVELAGTWPLASGRIRPWFGAGYNILHPRFTVNYRDSLGVSNDQKVKVNLSRLTAFGGVTLAVTSGILLSGEAYGAPSDLVTGRVRLTVGFGGRRSR